MVFYRIRYLYLVAILFSGSYYIRLFIFFIKRNGVHKTIKQSTNYNMLCGVSCAVRCATIQSNKRDGVNFKSTFSKDKYKCERTKWIAKQMHNIIWMEKLSTTIRLLKQGHRMVWCTTMMHSQHDNNALRPSHSHTQIHIHFQCMTKVSRFIWVDVHC